MKEGYLICFNEWALDKNIKDELGLLLIISSLTAEKGYCYASNDYLAKIFETSVVTISRKIKILEEKKYIKIEYEKKGCLVISRKIRLTKMLTAINKNVNRTINKNVKENNTINNNTINNKVDKKKERKREKKQTNYDSIINENIQDKTVKQELYEFIKMRKLIKKPLTDRALKLLISKLKKLSSIPAEQVQILDNSIINNWQGIFPLKNNSGYQNSNGYQNNNYGNLEAKRDGSDYAEFDL